jgi:hypothetical protein
MWTCPICNRGFVNVNQVHSCNEKSLSDFLNGKTDYTVGLFYHLVSEFKQIGEISIEPAKSMIAFASGKRFAYVIQLGKNFVDVVFPFKQRYEENMCFNKIKQVPGSGDFNHHLRLYSKEDVNEEVKKFIELAYKKSRTA